jgi:hypothetical protein
MATKKKILFRCSSIGNLMVEAKEAKITDVQLAKISELEKERDSGLNKNGNKVKWTDAKQVELDYLISKRDAPPQLSETAKREVEKVWLLNEKGFYKEIESKYLLKGLYNEENGLELISDLDGEFYIKNTKRITIGNLTGEADVVHEVDGKRIIKDIKSCYDAQTFMNGDLNPIYEAQGRAYMYLYDAEEFHLEYTLTDLPDHQLETEIWKVRNKYGITDPDTPEAQPLFDQIRRNFIYSNNPAYSQEERRKTFKIIRDKEWEEKMFEKIALGVIYYKSISLNQIR